MNEMLTREQQDKLIETFEGAKFTFSSSAKLAVRDSTLGTPRTPRTPRTPLFLSFRSYVPARVLWLC